MGCHINSNLPVAFSVCYSPRQWERGKLCIELLLSAWSIFHHPDGRGLNKDIHTPLAFSRPPSLAERFTLTKHIFCGTKNAFYRRRKEETWAIIPLLGSDGHFRLFLFSAADNYSAAALQEGRETNGALEPPNNALSPRSPQPGWHGHDTRSRAHAWPSRLRVRAQDSDREVWFLHWLTKPVLVPDN